MDFLKSGSNIFGIRFNKKEQRALDHEIKQTIDTDWIKYRREVNARVLWRLHMEFGFGKDRLFRFYKLFNSDLDDLVKKYDLDPSDSGWLATEALKEIDVDLEKWEKQSDGGLS